MATINQSLASLPTDRLLAEFSLWSADLVRIADDVARVNSFVDIYHAVRKNFRRSMGRTRRIYIF